MFYFIKIVWKLCIYNMFSYLFEDLNQFLIDFNKS